MIRVIGAVLIFGGCFGVGLLEGMQKKKTIDLLRDVLHGIEIVEREIDLNARPMPDSLALAAESRRNRAVMKMLNDCARASEKGERFTHVFASWADDVGIAEEQKALLCPLFDMLGKYDVQGQVNSIARTVRQVIKQLERDREEAAKKSRIYRSLGAAAGGMLTVLLL